MSAPVIQFVVCRTEQQVAFTGQVWRSTPRRKVGDAVDIIYDPQNPTRAKMAGWVLYVDAIFFGLVGLILFGMVFSSK